MAGGVAGEFFEQRTEAFPGNDVTQLEGAGGLGCHGLFVFNGGKQSAAPFCLVVTLHARSLRISLLCERALEALRFPEVP